MRVGFHLLPRASYAERKGKLNFQRKKRQRQMIRQIPNSYFPVPNREKKRGREFGQLWIVVRKKEGVSALGTTVKLTGHGETKKKNGIQHLKNIV